MATSTAQIDELIDDLVTSFPPRETEPVTFLGEQFDRGLAWVHFPVGEGGLGGTPSDQLYAMRKISKAGAPSAMGRNVIGYGMVAPTVVTHGTQRTEESFPAAALHGRGDLVPAVLRARCRIGRRGPRLSRREGRR